MELTMKIEGMMCPHCEAAVKKALEAIPTVESADVSHEKGTAVIRLSADTPFNTLKAAVEELRTRQEKYEGILQELLESGETQILTTDPEARRMHSKDGFHCCYNVQTAVDSGSHLIAEYEVTNHNTDQGLLQEVTSKAKEQLEVETISAVADKGYESRRIYWNVCTTERPRRWL